MQTDISGTAAVEPFSRFSTISVYSGILKDVKVFKCLVYHRLLRCTETVVVPDDEARAVAKLNAAVARIIIAVNAFATVKARAGGAHGIHRMVVAYHQFTQPLVLTPRPPKLLGGILP